MVAAVAATTATAKPVADTGSSPITDIVSATRGTENIVGYFDVFGDNVKGRVLLGVNAFDKPLLLTKCTMA